MATDYITMDETPRNNLEVSSSQEILVENELPPDTRDQFENESADKSSEKKADSTIAESPISNDKPRLQFVAGGSQSKDDFVDPRTTEEDDEKPRSVVNKIVTVEPSLFLFMLGLSFSTVTNSSLMIYKICHVTYNYTDAECANYTNDPVANELIQTKATDYSMYTSLIQTIPAVLYALFLGSWSDRHGRKLAIILPLFGLLLCNTANLIFAYYIDLPPRYSFISAVFYGLSGGFVAMMLGVFSYVSDITTTKNRTKRIAVADAAMGIALPIGMIISALIQKEWGYIPVYASSMFILSVGLVYSIFVLPESVQSPIGTTICDIFKDMFNVKNVIDNVRVCFKKRKGNSRIYLSLLLLSSIALMMPLMGESDIMLLFVQRKFGWNQSDLSIYNSYAMVITIIGTVIIFKFLLAKYKLPDMVLGVIGLCGAVLKDAIISISFASWMLYFAASVSFFQFLAMPTIRSFMSKLVDKEEIGNLFAVISSVEAIVPIISTVAYTRLYQESKEDFPGAVFLLSASLIAIPLTSFSWIHFNKKKLDKCNQIREDHRINTGTNGSASNIAAC